MYGDEELRKVSRVLKALSNVVRLKILLMLAETERPLHIEAVARNLGMDYGAVYRHVKVLKKLASWRFTRLGVHVFYLPLTWSSSNSLSSTQKQ